MRKDQFETNPSAAIKPRRFEFGGEVYFIRPATPFTLSQINDHIKSLYGVGMDEIQAKPSAGLNDLHALAYVAASALCDEAGTPFYPLGDDSTPSEELAAKVPAVIAKRDFAELVGIATEFVEVVAGVSAADVESKKNNLNKTKAGESNGATQVGQAEHAGNS